MRIGREKKNYFISIKCIEMLEEKKKEKTLGGLLKTMNCFEIIKKNIWIYSKPKVPPPQKKNNAHY